MENDISRKFVISVVAILVITLVMNNFSGEAVRSVRRTITCIDNSDMYTSGYAYYSDGSSLVRDSCRNIKVLDEATCSGGVPHRESLICTEGCVTAFNGGYCKQAPIKQVPKNIPKKK